LVNAFENGFAPLLTRSYLPKVNPDIQPSVLKVAGKAFGEGAVMA
jgi:hypothetical protein